MRRGGADRLRGRDHRSGGQGVARESAPDALLEEVFRQAPDPRAKNARFLSALTLTQRHQLGLPRKRGTQAFYQVPGYAVFYHVLTRLDAVAFAALLGGWLQTRAVTLPQALAVNGKMIRDHLGLPALARREDGAPQTVAIYDQKEGTARCEQSAATALLSGPPALDDKLVTADAPHCRKTTTRIIAENGGDTPLQIKGNQPELLVHVEACSALADTPSSRHRSRPRPLRHPWRPPLRAHPATCHRLLRKN